MQYYHKIIINIEFELRFHMKTQGLLQPKNKQGVLIQNPFFASL
jgi:hypothetical protein